MGLRSRSVRKVFDGLINMEKAILIKADEKLFAKIAKVARAERRKPGPMAVILLERYFSNVYGKELQNKESA
jgi:hypothetical protein